MGQKFLARQAFHFSNGAVGWAPGGPFDCLGPYAKVERCPIVKLVDGKRITVDSLTCYATGHPDTFFSVPACTKKRGKHVTGFFTSEDTLDGKRNLVFIVHNKYAKLWPTSDKTVSILSVDAWRGPGGWEWNNWLKIGAMDSALAVTISKRELCAHLRKHGILGELSKGKVMVEDDGYNLVVCQKSNGMPLFALAYGEVI